MRTHTHDPNTPRPQQHTHGDDDRLKNYLRQNKLSANLLDDESDVILLTGAKVRGASDSKNQAFPACLLD